MSAITSLRCCTRVRRVDAPIAHDLRQAHDLQRCTGIAVPHHFVQLFHVCVIHQPCTGEVDHELFESAWQFQDDLTKPQPVYEDGSLADIENRTTSALSSRANLRPHPTGVWTQSFGSMANTVGPEDIDPYCRNRLPLRP
jgi:hypothetical protein